MTERTRLPLFIRLEVETVEDLHTSAGTSSGDIDALVMRDRRGRPVIRASHLKGLLREAGEELIALGAGKEEELNALLGAPGKTRGALRMTSLRVAGAGKVKTLIWGSTKRVEGGRTPEEDTLRFVEHVSAGSHFEATLRLADPARKPLLERLLQRVDRIGGDRNRGSGLVRLKWRDLTLADDSELEKVGETRLRLVLRNLEPLCLPATGHPGNLIRGHSFIRSQRLRAALIAWAIQTGRTGCLELFKRLSVGDALPLPEGVSQAETVLPIPLSILTEKPKGGDPSLPWWAGGSPDPVAFDSLFKDRDQKGEKPKRPNAHKYLCRNGKDSPWLCYAPVMNMRLRNATPKRGSQADANLFSEEEIAEDTCFQTELRFLDAGDVESFVETFAPLLRSNDWLAIGRGGSPVDVKSIATGPETDHAPFKDDWTLTLISDLIVRGEYLGFLDHLDIDRLCALAGIEKDDSWEIEKSIVETESIHGFNAVTGLQRAPALALRRGSCWRIKGEGSAALAEALAARAYLGERTGEGFGRFLIDIQPIHRLAEPEGDRAAPDARRNEELLAYALELKKQIGANGPSLSQLQWLRERALAVTSPEQLERLLTEIETAPDRRPQGGKAWKEFPTGGLRTALGKFSEPVEKRLLISYLVQWRTPKAKENRK